MAIDLRQFVAVAGDVLVYLPLLLAIKFVIVLGLLRARRISLRSAVLAGALVMPFDEVAYVIMASAHSGGLLSDHAYTIGLSAISLSFVVCPLLINLAYRLTANMVDVPEAVAPRLP
jgi:Kef-type K+ transport system membrane component KefB